LTASGLATHAEDTTASKAPEVDTSSSPESVTSYIHVYYFHGDRRCKTCNTIESNTKEVLDTVYADKLTSGTVKWSVKNTDQKDNAHFEKDFELLFGSVVIVKFVNGKQVEWKNLQKVWELVWDKSAFNDYVQKELDAYLVK